MNRSFAVWTIEGSLDKNCAISQILVVADRKTPTDWVYPNVEFLGMEEQKQLGYNILPLTPLNSYA